MRTYGHHIIIVSFLSLLAWTSACAELDFDFEDAIMACSTDNDCASGDVCVDTVLYDDAARVCKRPCVTGVPTDFVTDSGGDGLTITLYCVEEGLVTGPAEIYYHVHESTRLECMYDACQLIGGDSGCPKEPGACACLNDGVCNYSCTYHGMYFDPDCP